MEGKVLDMKMKFIAPLIGATLLTTACSDEQTVTTASTESLIDHYVTYTNEDFYEAWQNDSYTTIQLDGTKVTTEGGNAAAVLVEDQTITLKGKGTYVVEGTFTDGQLVVDAAESGTVRIILNGASISSSTTAAISVKQADKTILSIEEGTENTVTDGKTRAEDDEATGAIYSKDDLTINGEGSLTVNANAYDGIVSKDNLFVTGGTLKITAADDGILGRDLFAMQNANVSIEAKGDGVKSTNDENEELGNIVLESGTLTINAGNDGIASVKDLIVLDGEYNVIAGGGSPETVSSGEEFGFGMMPDFNGSMDFAEGEGMQQQPELPTGQEGAGQQPPEMPTDGQGIQPPTEATTGQQGTDQQPPEMPTGGQGAQLPTDAKTGQQRSEPPTDQQQPDSEQATEEQSTTENTTPSTKGLKAESLLQIYGGTFTLDSLEDAIHSDGDVDINGGTFTINTGDDGLHADDNLTIAGGKIIVEKSYEGLEANFITIKGGHTELTTADDGVTVNLGRSEFGFGQLPTGMQVPNEASNTEATTEKATNTNKETEKADEEVGKLTIEDGYLFVDASGDGLDSNGDITMTGGTAIVYGPTNAGNGALDYDGTFDLQGGVLIAAGSSGMALGVSDSSTQNTVMMTFSSTLEANTAVTVTNKAGEVVAAVSPTKKFQTIVISTPHLQQEGTYSLNYGGKITGELENGFATSATVENVTKSVDFTFDSAMTYLDSNGVTEKPSEFGGMGGGFGGRGMGGRPNMQNGTNGGPGQQTPTTTEGNK